MVQAWTSCRVQASFHAPSVALEWVATASSATAASTGCTSLLVQENRFSRWRSSWISDQNYFRYFFICKSPLCFLPSKLAFWFRRRSEKYFQDGSSGGHLGFSNRTVLAIFDLQVTLLLPIKFQVNWPFGSGEEAKNRFSRWLPWQTSWSSDQNDFSYF